MCLTHLLFIKVNEKLKAMNIYFLEKDSQGKKNFKNVKKEDVVILPAFGATIEELRDLENRYFKVLWFVQNALDHCFVRGVTIVDATCPWVSKVWNAVDNHRQAGQTRYINRLE